MKTYIIKKHLKPILINELLKNQHSIFDIEIISLQDFIAKILHYQAEDILTMKARYQNLKLNELSSAINESSFIKQLQNDRYKLAAYEIDLDNLALHAEYKQLLKLTPSLDFKLLDNYLEQHDFSDYYIVEGNYSIFENQIIKKLIAKNAKNYHFETTTNHSYKVNVNLESDAIDGICQYLIENNIDLNNAAIIANQDLFDFIKIHTARYNIATNFTKAYQTSNKAKALVALIEYHLNPSINNYIDIVSSQIIKHDNLVPFIEYFRNHVSEIKYAPYDNLANFNNQYYQELEAKANLIHQDYYPILEQLSTISDFKEVLIYAYNLIASNDKESLKIKNILERYRDKLEDAYPFYRQELLNLKLNPQYADAILVTSFSDEVYAKDYLFVINPDINIYPGFKMESGFINEDILINSNYPKLKARYDQHLQHFDYLFKAKQTLFFLENTTLDGKGLEYDKFFDKLEELNINIVNNDNHFKNIEHHLDQNLAESIFFKNHDLCGSISRFEKYFNCPYSYFLNYGLALNEPSKLELSAALTGTIIHEVFEKLVLNYGKDYNHQSAETIRSYLNHYEVELKQLYPNKHDEINTIIGRIMNSIELELDFINDMEKHTVFKPIHPEYQFKGVEFTNYGQYKLKLNGIIDRVDESGQCFRILDYKTSIHKLSKTEIAKGLQLQLLTYVYIYALLSHKKAVAAYYLNVAHPKIDLEHYKFSKKSGIERLDIDEDFIHDKFMNAHKMNGLAFEDFEGLDDNYAHINSRSKKYLSKDSLIDYEQTHALLTEIYQYLLKNLSEGNIELSPQENACKYCKYHAICHFKGLKGLRSEAISDIDISLERSEDDGETE